MWREDAELDSSFSCFIERLSSALTLSIEEPNSSKRTLPSAMPDSISKDICCVCVREWKITTWVYSRA